MGSEYKLELSRGKQKHVYLRGFFFNKDDKLNLLVDAGGKSINFYVKENDCKNYLDTTLDEKFPTKDDNDRAETIKKNLGIQKYKLKLPRENYGKIMLTFETLLNEFAEVKITVFRSN